MLRRFIPFVLVLSLIVNLILLSAAGVLVERRGGIAYFTRRLTPPSTPTVSITDTMSREAQYQGDPITNGAAIFLGDSLTELAPWSLLMDDKILNRGINGDTIQGVAHRIDEVVRHHPRTIFLLIGINDLRHGRSTEQVIADYTALVETLRQRTPDTKIFIESLFPVNTQPPYTTEQISGDIVAVNKVLQTLADTKSIVYVDVYTHLVTESGQLNPRFTYDGLHLNGNGEAIWISIIRSYTAH